MIRVGIWVIYGVVEIEKGVFSFFLEEATFLGFEDKESLGNEGESFFLSFFS